MGKGNGSGPRAGMGTLVKQYRDERRVTQRDLATTAGIGIGTLRDLEQGRTRSPRWETMEELAAALGLGPAQRAELAQAGRACGLGPVPRQARSADPPDGVRVSVLGPLEARRDGTPLTLGSTRQRAVLGLLALHDNAGVHRNTIIDMLWGERPPASAVAVVQGYLSRLRKVLGDGPARTGGARLVTTVGGCSYRLNADPGHLDLALFGWLTREAQKAAARQDPGHACHQYEQALGLWRGDVLADIGLLHGHPAAVEVMSRHDEAVLGYAEAATEAGVHVRVLPHLRRLCTRETLNERAHAWLMTVLAATGQQAAALDVFTRLRRRLTAELGIAPSPVLARAHTQVLRQQVSMPRWPARQEE